MSISAFQAQFSANTPVQFIDPQSGKLTQTAQYLLLQLWNRTGQGTGIIPLVSSPLTATGSTITDALALDKDWNLVGDVPSGTGVRLLSLKPGNDIQVFNAGNLNLNVYPPSSSDKIDFGTNAGDPYVLPSGKLRIFECWQVSPAQFYSYGS